ncbi:TPA: prepilin-type N-terminal cleavage/methylation domain-containing protein [Klebsiella pneumoniae]|nr:prepilin-type N-terminal cleavage/methylation domain-containing protein [Klebsiella pneumoniae]
MKERKKGFSLIEMLLVLVVATGIAGATFYGYSKLQEGFRTSNAIRDLVSNTTSGSKIAATSSMADITAFCSSFNTSSVLVFTNAD